MLRGGLAEAAGGEHTASRGILPVRNICKKDPGLDRDY
jgi:hypothetical protein